MSFFLRIIWYIRHLFWLSINIFIYRWWCFQHADKNINIIKTYTSLSAFKNNLKYSFFIYDKYSLPILLLTLHHHSASLIGTMQTRNLHIGESRYKCSNRGTSVSQSSSLGKIF